MRKILLFSTLMMAMPWLWCPDVAAADKLDLNQATVEELDALPGVGPAIARRIVAFREKNGAFKRIEDLMNVRGIGEKTFLRLRDRITVKASLPALPRNRRSAHSGLCRNVPVFSRRGVPRTLNSAVPEENPAPASDPVPRGIFRLTRISHQGADAEARRDAELGGP